MIEEVGIKTCLVDNHSDIFYECDKNDDKGSVQQS